MVGNLTEQVRTVELHQDAESSVSTEGRIMTLDLTPEQLNNVMSQWSPPHRHSPVQFVLKVEGREVGVLHVVSSLFVPYAES